MYLDRGNRGIIMNKRVVDTWNKVAKDFGKIGPKYWNYFGRQLVEISQVKSGSTVLDIGCGAGASLFPAAEKVGNHGQAIGIDIAESMVKVCEESRKSLSLSNVEVLEMDAAHLAFNDHQFDYVLNGFGLPYLYNADHDFAGIKQVLVRHGSFCMVTWDEQDDNPWLSGLIQKYLPPANLTDKKEDNKQEKERQNEEQANKKKRSLTSEEDLRMIFQEAGFCKIHIQLEDRLFTYEDKDQWWAEMNSNAVKGILDRIEATGQDKLEQLKQEVYKGLEQYRTDEGFTFKRSVYYIIAKL